MQYLHFLLVGQEHRVAESPTLTRRRQHHGNYASSLNHLRRFKEAKALFLKIMPVAQRILGESSDVTLRSRFLYALALYRDPGATLDDLREAVTTLEETERIARRVLGGAHPLTVFIQGDLQDARAALAARETPSASA